MATLNHSISYTWGTLYRDKPVEWLRNLARTLYDWRWYRVSLTCYHLLVRLEPDNDNTWHDRGVIFSDLGEYDRALADYREALRIYPQHDRAHYNIGQALWCQGQYAEAIEPLTRAVELDDGRGLYWYGLALAQHSAGREQAARKSLQKAIALGSDTQDVPLEEMEELARVWA